MDIEKLEQFGDYIPPKYKSQKFNLLIDGNFWCSRLMYASFLDFKNQNHEVEFLTSCFDTLRSEIKALRPYINKIIFVRDNKSWRKKITPIVPHEMEALRGITKYKENRVLDDKIDWKAFGQASSKFYTKIEELGIPVVSPDGAEGDDSIAILALIFANNGYKSLIWSSDGDMKQLVSDYCMFYKIGRKDVREIYMNSTMAEYYDKLSTGIMLGQMKPDTTQELLSKATLVETVDKYKYLLEKIVSGDTKDNVSALFWKEKQGKDMVRKYAPTKAQVKKFLKSKKLETVTEVNLYDPIFINDIVESLIEQNKMNEPESYSEYMYESFGKKLPKFRDINHTIDVFNSNRNLLYLDKKEIPQPVIKGVLSKFKEVYQKPQDLDKFMNVDDVMLSIPHEDSFFNKFLNDI